MSRKTTKSILSRDEITLLKNSEEPKKTEIYGNLYDAILQIKDVKAITLEELSLINLNESGIAALTYNKKSLMENVNGEWYVESQSSEDPDKKVRCGLCNTPNKYLYYIRNRLNNIQLNVGSFCMTKFPGIDGYTEYKYQLNKTIRTQKEASRRTEFHKKFPNVIEIIDSASYYFDNLPILLPYNIYYQLGNTIKNLRFIYTKYIKSGKTPFKSEKSSFELFDEFINKYNQLKIESDIFIERNRGKKLICKRQEIDWMLENKKSYLLDIVSKNNGFYTVSTISEIYSVDFIIDNFLYFSKCNSSTDIQLVKPKDNNSSFFFIVKNKGFIFLYRINIKKFMKNIGSYCIFNNDYKYEKRDLLQVSVISDINSNVISIIEYLEEKLNSMGYVFLIDDYTKDIFLYKKVDKSVKIFSSIQLLKLCDSYMIKKNIDIYKFISILISKKWLEFEEQEQQGIDEKVSNLYYQQYIEPYK